MLTDQQVLAEAIKVVSNAFLGVLTTVDEKGVPHSRWMGAAAMDGIGRIYTLSGGKARKIEHIHKNPNVCWVFSSADFADVVTLTGQARVLESPVIAQMAWDRLASCARSYAMSVVSDDANLQFVTVETAVRQVEFISPRLKVFHPAVVNMAASR